MSSTSTPDAAFDWLLNMFNSILQIVDPHYTPSIMVRSGGKRNPNKLNKAY